MEIRKQKEIEHYDKKARQWLSNKKGDFEGFQPFLLGSYNFLANFLKNKCQGKEILDYGCGNGIHSIRLAQSGAKVTGIDLSEPFLKIAKERAEKLGVADRTKFLLMDCENLKFPYNSFDIVFDGGTFSSLDLEKAFLEITRALKPNGFLVGIETLGHNPFTNLKRKINKLTGKRTNWAVGHIFTMNDVELAKKYFERSELYFFHLFSWIAFPLLSLPIGKILLKFLEKCDKILFSLPFLKKYAFKIVFVFSSPKK